MRILLRVVLEICYELLFETSGFFFAGHGVSSLVVIVVYSRREQLNIDISSAGARRRVRGGGQRTEK